MHQRLSGARNVEEGIAGANDLAQARSDGEDEVGLTHALRELRTRPDGEVARIAGVEVVDAVLAAKRAGGREPVALGERDDVADRPRRPRAAPEQHQRPTRSGEQLAQPRHLGRPRACLHRFVGCGVDRRRGLAQHVFREHDHHRAGPSGSRQRKCSRRQLRDAGRVVDLHHPLGHLAVHSAEVELLERPAPKKGARDLSDEEDHRRRVLIGRVHADARVGRARTARNETDARPASEFAVGFGHVGGAAFLPAHDEADLLARVIERVEYGEVALARHAVGSVDAMDEELIDEDLCAGAGPRRAAVRENRSRAIAAPIAGLIVSFVVSHVVTFPVTFNIDRSLALSFIYRPRGIALLRTGFVPQGTIPIPIRACPPCYRQMGPL